MQILVPVDGSDDGKAAVKFVASRAALIRERPAVELLNVQYPIAAGVVRALGSEQTGSYQASAASKILSAAAAVLARAGIEARSRHAVGSPAAEVARLAEEAGMDLVVMGSHGLTGLRRLLFGSVTAAVLAAARTAVWIVRERAVPRKDALKALLAVDGTAGANAAVDYVCRHRALFGGQPRVTLAHVAPDLVLLALTGPPGERAVRAFKPGQAQAMQDAAFEYALAPARKRLAEAGIGAGELRLVGYSPGDEIADLATEGKYDVVVIGAPEAAAGARSLLGTVGTRIAQRCARSLLLVPAG